MTHPIYTSLYNRRQVSRTATKERSPRLALEDHFDAALTDLELEPVGP